MPPSPADLFPLAAFGAEAQEPSAPARETFLAWAAAERDAWDAGSRASPELAAEGFALLRAAVRESGAEMAESFEFAWGAIAARWMGGGSDRQWIAQFAGVCLAQGASPKKRWPLGLCDWPDRFFRGAKTDHVARLVVEAWMQAGVWPGELEPLAQGEPEGAQKKWAEWDSRLEPASGCLLDQALACDLKLAERWLAAAGPEAFTAHSSAWLLSNKSALAPDIQRWIDKGLPWNAWQAPAIWANKPDWAQKARVSGVELMGEMMTSERWDILLWQLERQPLAALESGALASVEILRMIRPVDDPNGGLGRGRACSWFAGQPNAFGAHVEPPFAGLAPWSDPLFAEQGGRGLFGQEGAATQAGAAAARGDASTSDLGRRPLRRAAELLLWHWPAGGSRLAGPWGGRPATLQRVVDALAAAGARLCETPAEEDQMARRLLGRARNEQTGREKTQALSHALKAWAALSGAKTARGAIERALAERPGALGSMNKILAERAALGVVRSGLWIDSPHFVAEQLSWAASGRVRQYTPEAPGFGMAMFGMGVWDLWGDALGAWCGQIGPEALLAILAEPLGDEERASLAALAAQGGGAENDAQAIESLQEDFALHGGRALAIGDERGLPSAADEAILGACQRRAARQKLACGLRWLPLQLFGGLFTASGPWVVEALGKAIAAPAAKKAIFAGRLFAADAAQAQAEWDDWKSGKSARQGKEPPPALAAIEKEAAAAARRATQRHLGAVFRCVAIDSGHLHPADRLADWARCLGKPAAPQAARWLREFVVAAAAALPYGKAPAAWGLWCEEALRWRGFCSAEEQRQIDELAMELGLNKPPLPGAWTGILEARALAREANLRAAGDDQARRGRRL